MRRLFLAFLVLLQPVPGAFASNLTDHEFVLPSGLEKRILDLMGPHARGKPLPGGWVLGDTRIQTHSVHFEFHENERSFVLVLSKRSSPYLLWFSSRNFRIDLRDTDKALSGPESTELLCYLSLLILERDRGKSPWTLIAQQTAIRLLANPTMALQIILLAAFLLVLLRIRHLIRLVRRIPAGDYTFLAIWMGLGAFLRAIGGVRVPGWINSHGYQLLSDVLIDQGIVTGADPHGHGFRALYGLILSVLPTSESTVIAFQFAFSLLSIPLVYLVCRFMLGERLPSLWAAAAAAVLPALSYFATTEVRLVPGLFFLLLTFSMLGAALRDRHPLSLLAVALLGAITTQFYPVFMVLPALLVLVLVTSAGSRALIGSVWAWIAAAVFLAIWSVPALWHIAEQPLGFDFLTLLLNGYHVFVPEFTFHESISNIFLNYHFTPPTLALAALLGLVVCSLNRDRRYPALTVLACALALTMFGFLDGRMNLARLQLAAQPFNAMLAGVGLSWGIGYVPQLRGRLRNSSRLAAGGAFIILSVAVWPGPTAKLFSPQLDRRVFSEGMAQMGDGCVLMWQGLTNPLPIYLLEERAARIRLYSLTTAALPLEIGQPSSSCVFYYRPSTCFVTPQDDERPPQTDKQPRPNDPLCIQIERQLRLEPVFVRRIPALPDCLERYLYDELEVGFFRVKEFPGRSGNQEKHGETRTAKAP